MPRPAAKLDLAHDLETLQQASTRRYARSYVLALGLVALLSLVGHAVVQVALLRQLGDATVVNVAGRQRMLSQRLVKKALSAAGARSAEERARHRSDMAATLDEWERGHQALTAASDPEVRPVSSTAIEDLFDELEPHRVAMVDATRTVLATERPGAETEALPPLLAHEGKFLGLMDRIVDQYEREARTRLQMSRLLELCVLLGTLLVLWAEVRFIFRPTLRTTEAALAALSEIERERLAALEASPDAVARVDDDADVTWFKAGSAAPGVTRDVVARLVPLLNSRRDEGPKVREWDTELAVTSAGGTRLLAFHGTSTPRGDRLLYVRDVSERRAMERSLVEANERTQRRIGRDLHDGTCQQLAGISMLVRSIAASRQDAAGPDAELEKVAALLDEALEQTSGLARHLLPTVLTQRGLAEATETTVANQIAAYGLDLGLHIDPAADEELVGDAALQLYRITQEAVSNALRHGQARRIDVRLAREDIAWVLEVRDDGVGFDPGQRERAGLGIQTMRQRARGLGASLTIESSEGGGTAIRCRLQRDALPAATREVS